MGFEFSFNTDGREGFNADFDPIPDGWYYMTCVGAEITHEKPRLKTTWEIDGDEHPEHAGRKIWVDLYLWAESEAGRRVNEGKLTSILQAGKPDDPHIHENTDELIGLRVLGKVKVVPARTDTKTGRDYGPKNEVSSFKNPNKGVPSHAASSRAASTNNAPAAATSGGTTPPWRK